MSSSAYPLVSVVLPVFNAEPYLKRSVESILQGSYKNIELILINDGSTDASANICYQFQISDKRVRFVSRENRGLITTLNEGIDAACGEWIARMDADDIADKSRISNQIKYAINSNADVIGGCIRTFGYGLKHIRKFYKAHESLRLQLLFNSCFAHPSVIAKASVLKLNKYSLDHIHVEDYELWTRLMFKGYRFINSPDVVLNYRIHPNQVSQLKAAEQAHARTTVAKNYKKTAFPDLYCESEFADVLSRGQTLNKERISAALQFFQRLKSVYGNPENVIDNNAFLFLARHPEFGAKEILRAQDMFDFSFSKAAVIACLSMLRQTQNSSLYKFIYSLR